MTLDRRLAALRGLSVPILLLGLTVGATLAKPVHAETYMTVADVPIDVTAKSAAAARDQAIAGVQSKAFARLLRRLVPNAADQARIRPSQSEIESFVQDFAVESERTSSVRYIGRYSVRFRASRVRHYLQDAGIQSVSDLQQVLLVPLYKGPSGTVLWGQANAWRNAWDQGGFGDGPVSLILPNGDAFDSGTASAAAVAAGDLSALVPLIQRYHTAGIVVAAAAPRDPASGPASGLSITLSTYDMTGPKGSQTLAIDPAGGETSEKILRRGVIEIATTLESGWRQAIDAGGSIGLVGHQPEGEANAEAGAVPAEGQGGLGTLYPIAMPITDIAEWVRVRDQLATLPGVQRVSLDALTRSSAAFTLDFTGDPLALQTVLASSGFVLVQTAPGNAATPGAFELRRVAPVAASGAP